MGVEAARLPKRTPRETRCGLRASPLGSLSEPVMAVSAGAKGFELIETPHQKSRKEQP
jgi:hypothetical protein